MLFIPRSRGFLQQGWQQREVMVESSAAEGGAHARGSLSASLLCLAYSAPLPLAGHLPDHGYTWVDRSWCHTTLPSALNPRHPLREFLIPVPTALGLVVKEGSRERSCVSLNQGSCPGNSGHQLAKVTDPDRQVEAGLQSPRGRAGRSLFPGGYPDVSSAPRPQCWW